MHAVAIRSWLPAALVALAVSQAAWPSGWSAVDAQVATTAQVGADAPPVRHVDRSQLMRDVTTLASPAFEGRRTGTPGSVRARDWIVQQFTEIGLAPGNGSGYTQPFTFVTRDVRAALPGGQPYRTEYSATNVVGRVAGRDPRAATIVMTAHYDHLGIRDGMLYPGADDNASGVVVLLAAARYFKEHQPRHPMVFAALDAEELGQHGARALIASNVLPPGRVRLNVNLDMLSRNDANEIYAAGSYYSPWQTPILQDVQTRAAVTIRFGHDRPNGRAAGSRTGRIHPITARFMTQGVPFVYFGVEDHADYHQPTDTADRIDPRFFGDVADMIVEAVSTFDARLD